MRGHPTFQIPKGSKAIQHCDGRRTNTTVPQEDKVFKRGDVPTKEQDVDSTKSMMGLLNLEALKVGKQKRDVNQPVIIEKELKWNDFAKDGEELQESIFTMGGSCWRSNSPWAKSVSSGRA